MGNHETGQTPDSTNGKKPGFQISKEPVVYGKPEEDAHKYEATLGEPPFSVAEPPAYEDLGALPSAYGSRSLFLIARDPHWLFCYWDIDWQEYPPSRIPGGKIVLKVYNADGAEIYAAEVDPEARNWYIPASHGNALFYAELGFTNHDGAWEVIVRSNDASTPSDAISEDVRDSFATVPYHLAFQKVLDLVKMTMEEGESLLSALARIQNEGRRLVFALGSAPAWTDDQRRLLAALLGTDLAELLTLSSGEIDQLLRKQLKERLSSENSSGLFPGEKAGEINAVGAIGESSLSSGFGGFGAFGSWTELSSWTLAAESAFWSSWLTSWSGGGENAAALSSWLASWSSGRAGESGFWSSYLSSWGGAKESAFWSSWMSSWSGGMGGLGGASGAFGSREFGASWSAQPFGVPREFFMHVNAEVIFYGGTHPDAKVTIDGKPITLNPDGSFRYHFKFPDGDYAIPIVAESPDGVEKRSATLRFERNTARQGNVGATAQPAHLDDLGDRIGRN